MCVPDLGAMWMEHRLLLRSIGALHVRLHFAVLRIIIFVVVAGACSSAEAQKTVMRVVIDSGSGGLGGGGRIRVVIKRKGDQFLRRVVLYAISVGQPNGIKTRVVKREGDRPVSTVQVQSLVDALSAASMPRPELKNFGITKEWLAAKVESQKPRNISQSEMTASQKELFQKSFTDLNLVENLLSDLLIPEIYDYSAFCKVEIVFDDGSKLSAESNSYGDFMLPWIMNGRRETYNYNADISRAIAALLPAQSPNKATLQADELDNDLAAVVMISIEKGWNSLGPH